MSQYIHFFIAHWSLSLLFIGSFILVISMEAGERVGKGFMLTAQELVQKINHDHAKVIDIRNQEMFELGHIVDAENLSTETIAEEKWINSHKEATVVLVDDQGRDAPKILQALQKQGLINAYLLKGGLTAWRQAEFPLVKG